MIEWAMGQKHVIEEVDCIAMGTLACLFRIGK
jgi:predicted hydrocarbon binding protein